MALVSATNASTTGGKGSGAVSGVVDYAKLKKDVQFHETRLHLLLTTRVVEDLHYILKEKQDARWSCYKECVDALATFERNAATEGKLSGRWSEARIASTFGLELPLVVVVGSEKFEKPNVRADDVAKLLEDVHQLSRRFSEFAPPEPQESDVEKSSFLNELHHLQWTPRDMEKMRAAITSKLAVLTELTDLTKALHQSQYQVSAEGMKLEALRRDEERAMEDGEMALSDAAIRERMQVLKRTIDHLFFQAHTIDSSVDSNISKKRSNLALFQEGTAVLSCLRGEKDRLVETCNRDMAKIRRGLEFEEKQRADSKSLAMLQESRERMAALDLRQRQLSDHLERVAREFMEAEEAMIELGHERQQAMKDHMDLLESRRHLNSDNNEKISFAEQYRANLDRTKSENLRSIDALTRLEKLLLKQTTFDAFDFQATAKRLHTMQRRVAIELNRALNEYEAAGAELLRRLSAQLRVVSEQVDQNELQAEIKKETLDPLAKKYVLRAREYAAARDEIAADCKALRDLVEAERDAIMHKIEQHLDPTEIIDHSEATMLLSAARSEELLDYRQELITPPDVAILDERLRVTREFQTNVTQAAARTATRKATTSKVLAIRDDVERQKKAAMGESDGAPAASGPTASPQRVADDSFAPPDLSAVSLTGDVEDGDEAHGVPDSSLSVSGVTFSKSNEDRAMQYRGSARVIGERLA